MNQYKYFEKEGSVYKFKPQTVYKAIIAILVFGLAIFCWITDVKILAGIFALLCSMIVVTMFSDKFEINTNKETIELKQGIYMQSRSIPFDKIIGFEMFTTSINFIRSSVALNLYYENDNGKEKVMKVAQSMSKMHIQKIINEVDEILEQNGHSRKV